MQEGAIAAGKPQKESEIKILLVEIDNGVSQLRMIRNRLVAISESIHGPKPRDPEPVAKGSLVAIKPVNVAERLRDTVSVQRRLREEIAEVIQEIEDFI